MTRAEPCKRDSRLASALVAKRMKENSNGYGSDKPGYDPEEDADLYEYWKAEDRYWEAS
jgi:hypothetical protein